MTFLNAEWRKLILLNYEIDPNLLRQHLPYGTELDLWQDKCYISVVGFMFVDTRVLGLKIPYHINFEEVNLRFYVKRIVGEDVRRGVVFIKEIVPKSAITFVANNLYKENYETLPMRHQWTEDEGNLSVEYAWKKHNKWNHIRVDAHTPANPIPTDSGSEFITEHYWGYAKVSDTQTNEYEVTHPRWHAYKVKNYDIDIAFASVYGEKFGILQSIKPDSIMLAEGSQITVEGKKSIR